MGFDNQLLKVRGLRSAVDAAVGRNEGCANAKPNQRQQQRRQQEGNYPIEPVETTYEQRRQQIHEYQCNDDADCRFGTAPQVYVDANEDGQIDNYGP